MSTGRAENVDPGELARFARLAARWWDPDGPQRALHDLNPLRLEFVRAQLPLAGRRVLDLGCGGGLLAEAMARAGADVLGIDLAEDLLAVARWHAEDVGLSITYRRISAEALAEECPGRFDLVTCMELLEHVPDPEAILSAALRLLAPGGVLVVSTLNRTLKSFALGIVAAEYLLGIVPRGTHRFDRFLKPSEIAAVLRREGAELLALRGVGYEPFARRCWLETRPDVNYLLAARRP